MSSRFSRLLFAAAIIVTISTSAAFPQPQKAKESAAPSQFMDLTRFAFLRDFFNLAQGAVRTIAIVSPTCPTCRKGVAEISRSLENIPGNRFRAFVIFSPELEGDTREKASELAGQFFDRRLVYFWDAEKLAGNKFKTIAGSESSVWDVYFLYDTDAVIDSVPPAPALWMQQHERHEAPQFDAEVFQGKALELLDRLQERMREESKASADTEE